MNFGTDTSSARAPLVLGALAGLLTCILSAPPALAQTQSPMAEWQYSGGVALESRYINNPPAARVSVGFYNDESDIQRLIEGIQAVQKTL